MKKYKFYIGRPEISGSGGTFGYETLHQSNDINYLLHWKPVDENTVDCYGIDHRVKIIDENNKYLYSFNNDDQVWEKI
jgi:hypothetical protein